MASEFESWLSERLTQFNADGDVFSTYILGILDSEETQDEKQDNLCDLLEGLGLDDGQVDPCERLKKEIWSKWSSVKDPSVEDEKAKEKSIKATDLGATLAAHAESQTKAFKQSKGTRHIFKTINVNWKLKTQFFFLIFPGHGSSTSNDKDKEAIKAAILAQYNNAVEESGSEEESDGCDDTENDLMAKNTNAEAVAKAQQDQREKSKAAAQAKKDKDKEDREKQKKDQEDRKKKAQEKAAKGERKR